MSLEISRGMALAAGLGTRMRPLTLETPKPLVEVAGRTLIDRALDQLKAAGVTDAVVNLHWLGDQIEAHLHERSDLAFTFTHENPVLETGGGVENALEHLADGPFFVLNTDTVLTDGAKPALERLKDAWDERAMDALLLLQPVETAHGYDGPGDFFLETDGKLKRRGDAKRAPYVFTGAQILHPCMFFHAPGGIYSLNVLYDQALAVGRLYGLVHDGGWHHVGTIESIAKTTLTLQGGGP